MLYDLFWHSEKKNNLRTICQFCSACCEKICSVNLDCETTFLTLADSVCFLSLIHSYDDTYRPLAYCCILGQVILSQLRVGRSPLTREVLHRIGRAADPWCPNCGEPEIDTTRHLLAECPAYSAARSSLWGGPLPTMSSVLGADAAHVLEFLWRVGRTDPPVDTVTADPPAGGSA